MARIAGVDLARNKRIEIALGYIFGVGRATANKILKDTGVNPDTKVHELTEGDIKKIREYLQTIRVEGDLRRDVYQNIKRLIDIGSYRGLRHKRSLPVRGQRTKTNARTRKGPRKTVGVMRKEVKAMVDNTAAKK
ncbi:MAG: 30S ribosomal protein S13 [Candidatus Firestonebacteria bacterium RIFOXYA2_FULL_40_8]|nr:MAG: 30S ribosomal protein S13 [Candidatus Firestonebacteria bacterium RIFOXYA2_FULL_40_8]